MIEESEISELNQLAKTLEDSFEKLEKTYEKKNSEDFNKVKKILLQAQKRIVEIAT